VSQFPYVGLLRTIAGIVGPLFYKIGPTALEAAYNDTRLWALPVPGASLDLPLLGQVLRFHVPWTGSEGDPAATAQLHNGDTADPTRSIPRPLPAARPNKGLTLAEVFAAKHSEVPGVFQEIGLFAAFRSLTPCLWSIWELVITGQPLLLLGASPDVCGDAVMGAVSLIAPMRFSGDFRPYCTLYDPDFKGLAAAVNAAGEADVAAASSGVSGWAMSFMGGGGGKAASINSPRLPGPVSRPRPDGGTSAQLPPPHLDASTVGSRSSSAVQPSIGRVWQAAQSAVHLPAIPPFGAPLSPGAAYAVPFQTMSAAERRRRRRQPAHLNSGLATRDASRSDVGLLPESCPVIIGSTNPYFTRALGNCPNAVWLGAHPPLLPVPNPTSLPSVPHAGGGAGALRRRTSFLQPALHSVQESDTTISLGQQQGEAHERMGSFPLDVAESAFVSSHGTTPSAGGRNESTGGTHDDTDAEGSDQDQEIQMATAAELAAATAAVLRRVEQPAKELGFTSGRRVKRSASAGAAGSVRGAVPGHREMMTPTSRRNTRTSGSSTATAPPFDAEEASWSLAELSTGMLLDGRSASGEASPNVDSPVKGAGGVRGPHVVAAHDEHSVSASDAADEHASTAAGGTDAGAESVASRSSVATHLGHIARTFSPQVLRAAAAAYHASFAAKHSMQVLKPVASLADALPGPGETSAAGPVFAMRRAAWVKPDDNVLRQLLPLRRVDEVTLQERLAAGHGIHVSRSSVPTSSEGLHTTGSGRGQGAGSTVAFRGMLEGHVPAVLINNALLRQHFRSLTRDFLQPFEGYFSVARAAAVAASVRPGGSSSPLRSQAQPVAAPSPVDQQPPAAETSDSRQRSVRSLPSSAGGVQLQHSYGPYDDLADALLPAFDKSEFFAQLKRRGPPKLLASSKWLALYRAFVAGPLFPTWFQARRAEAKQHLRYLSRALRVSASDASLHACIVPRSAPGQAAAPVNAGDPYALLTPQEANGAAANACTLWHRIRVALRDAYGAQHTDVEYHSALRRHASVVWHWLRPDARQLMAETEHTMHSFGDADSVWILEELVGQQPERASTPRALVAAEAIPASREAGVDFTRTQHAIARSALGVMESSHTQGQAREPSEAASPTRQGPPSPQQALPTPAAATGDERTGAFSAAQPAVMPLPLGSPAPPVHLVAASTTASQPHERPSQAPNTASPTTPRASQTASGEGTSVLTPRVHSSVHATPLPISPDVSSAHPHMPSSMQAQPRHAPASAFEPSTASTVIHLPAAEGGSHSVVLGAGGLIGQSRSLGKGHIAIQRR